MAFKLGIIASGGAMLLGLAATALLCVATLFTASLHAELYYAVALSAIGALALVVVGITAYVTVMSAGAKPFPAAPDSDLPTVLKALHLQRAFTRFVIDNQMHAAGRDGPSAQRLHDNFATFVADLKPNETGDPTQAAGVIGI